VLTTDAFLAHDAGPGHPERPARLSAVLRGIEECGLGDGARTVVPRAATLDELAAVHAPAYVAALERRCAAGGGALDADTSVVAASWEAAVLAAGAGLDAVERLRAGEATSAFCVVRPPGHHATPTRAMGFCLFNNVAVTAMALADAGERVAIVDWDAHHGNGTQEVFWRDERVLYVSLHQQPLYPGTGRLDERGDGDGLGTTLNVPLPAGATGDVYLRAMDEVVGPVVASFAPTWLLVSAGFDAHRADPLTGLALSSGDFADLTARVRALVPASRLVLLLEGGYDLEALRTSAAACTAALEGIELRPEAPTRGGGGLDAVRAAAALVSR